jgi:hypothetical protein
MAPEIREQLRRAARDPRADLDEAALRRRVRQLRRRRVASTVTAVALLALLVPLGQAGLERLREPVSIVDRPVAPELVPTTATTSPLPREPIPSPVPDPVRGNRPRAGSAESRAFGRLASELRRCPGGASVPADLVAYVWSREYQRFWMLAAKQPRAPETRFCWTSGLFDAKAGFSLWGARRIRSPGAPLTHMGGIHPGFALIEGRVTKQATHVRLRFRDGRPPMDLLIIRAGDRYPTNFYVGFFLQGPTSPAQGGWAAATLTALDAAGQTVATCRVGPPGDGTPKCPGS